MIDVSPIKTHVTEHQKLACDCPNCGIVYEGAIPKNLKGNVQYGENIHAMIAYLSTYPYIPVQRASQLLSDLLGIQISEGTICNRVKSMATKAETTIYQEIRSEVEQATCVGGDETGIKIKGNRGCFFVFQTPGFKLHYFQSKS